MKMNNLNTNDIVDILLDLSDQLSTNSGKPPTFIKAFACLLLVAIAVGIYLLIRG